MLDPLVSTSKDHAAIAMRASVTDCFSWWLMHFDRAAAVCANLHGLELPFVLVKQSQKYIVLAALTPNWILQPMTAR